jgi:drug/metabolite transporter superfamily protein YnfA
VIAYSSTFIVGIVFFITGIYKALSSKQFIFHTAKYGLLPSQIVAQVAVTFIALESTLGVALLLHEFPQWLVPVSIILLVCLSALTIWSTSSGRTEDCGCYGGLLVVTPKQSILLNLGYILLLGIACFYPVAGHNTETWQWILALIVLISTSILSWQTRQQPIVDLYSLKPGKRWRERWLKKSTQNCQQGSHFVVFLSPDCGGCKRWLPLLNVMNTHQNLPQVMGILPISNHELETFKVEQMVRFPLVAMDKLLFSYMVDAYPTAVLIENGVITNKWEGEIPKEFLDKIKQSYESLILPNAQKLDDRSNNLASYSNNEIGTFTE